MVRRCALHSTRSAICRSLPVHSRRRRVRKRLAKCVLRALRSVRDMPPGSMKCQNHWTIAATHHTRVKLCDNVTATNLRPMTNVPQRSTDARSNSPSALASKTPAGESATTHCRGSLLVPTTDCTAATVVHQKRMTRLFVVSQSSGCRSCFPRKQ